MMRAYHTISFRQKHLRSMFHIDCQKVSFLIVSKEIDSNAGATGAAKLVVSGARSKLIAFKLIPSLNELYVISVHINQEVSIDGAN